MAVDLSALVAELENTAAEAFVEAQQQMVDLLIEVTPRGETGVLSESYRATVGSMGGSYIEGTIENVAPYASYVDEGTAPHEIQGNPLLAFEWGGATVIVHSVQHPGTDPQPFWTDTMTDEQWTFLVQQALDSLSG